MIIKLLNSLDRIKLKEYIDNLPEKKFLVEIKALREKRSNPQNGWLFGCIYPIMLQALVNQGWDFTTVEEVHEFCKKTFTSEKKINRYTGEIIELPTSTKEMDKAVFCVYCDTIRDWCYEFLDVEIPDPIKKEYREYGNQ